MQPKRKIAGLNVAINYIDSMQAATHVHVVLMSCVGGRGLTFNSISGYESISAPAALLLLVLLWCSHKHAFDLRCAYSVQYAVRSP